MSAPVSAWPAKSPVVAVPISRTGYAQVLDAIDRRPRDRATVVAVCNVHSIMTARRDGQVAQALGQADIATPDGMPLVWMLRRTAGADQTRVYGPDLMRLALAEGVERGWRHYFLGATDETIGRLTDAVNMLAPGVEVVGSWAPPFRPLTDDEEAEIHADIRACAPDVVWVGMGMPKQELWMHRAAPHLSGIALVGVGAAFDFLAGTVKEAPDWVQRAGFEWLYRLAREPRRLWRRYLLNNPLFMLLAFRQLLSRRQGIAAAQASSTSSDR